MKEKIEEMAADLCLIDRCKHLPQEECNMTTCAHCEAEALYNAGYLKQSEVIDEFASELKEYLDDTYSTGEDVLIDINDLIDHIAAKMKGGAE